MVFLCVCKVWLLYFILLMDFPVHNLRVQSLSARGHLVLLQQSRLLLQLKNQRWMLQRRYS
jgi:hypothetical protein